MFSRTVSGTTIVVSVILLVALLVSCGDKAPPAPPPPPPPPEITAAEIRDLVQDAVKQSAPQAPAPVDQAQLQKLIQDAVAGAAAPAGAPSLTKQDVEVLVKQAITGVAAAQKPGMTQADLEKAVASAVGKAVMEALPTATPAPQPEVMEKEPYFKGKTIRLVTSSSPGGGTDTQARYFAARWGKFIPGNPRVVVSNVTPHVAGINYLWQAKNDGTVIAYISHSPLREENFDEAKYDSKGFKYLGDIGDRSQVLAVRGNLGYKTIQDIMGAEGPTLTFTAQAPNPLDIENTVLGWMLLADNLNLPLEIKRVAETGTSVQILDTERGNMNANQWGGGAWFLLGETRPDWFSENYIIPVLDLSLTGSRAIPNAALESLDIPHYSELFTPEQVEQWQGMVEGTRNLNRPLWLPPGTPDDVMQILIKALEDALADKEFTDDYTKVTGAPIRYTPSADVAKSIEGSQKAIAKWQDQIDVKKEELFPLYFK